MTQIENITAIICVLSSVYMLIMMLTPDRYRAKMKTVISILTALTIAAAVLKTDFSFDDFEMENYDYTSGYDYSEAVLTELDERLAVSIAYIYDENGIPVEKIAVKTNIDGDESIFISVISLTVTGGRDEYEDAVRRVTLSEIGDVPLEMSFSEDVDET